MRQQVDAARHIVPAVYDCTPDLIQSATRSAIIMVVAFVFARIRAGITDASV